MADEPATPSDLFAAWPPSVATSSAAPSLLEPAPLAPPLLLPPQLAPLPLPPLPLAPLPLEPLRSPPWKRLARERVAEVLRAADERGAARVARQDARRAEAERPAAVLRHAWRYVSRPRCRTCAPCRTLHKFGGTKHKVPACSPQPMPPSLTARLLFVSGRALRDRADRPQLHGVGA